jgi:hypothetical protein
MVIRDHWVERVRVKCEICSKTSPLSGRGDIPKVIASVWESDIQVSGRGSDLVLCTHLQESGICS